MFDAKVHLADGSVEEVPVWWWNEFPFPRLHLERRGKGARGYTADYYDALITLDTETSKATHIERRANLPDLEVVDGCWIYQWAIDFNGDLIAGRDAQQLITFLRSMYDHYQLDAKKHMVVWIHNIAYDSSYLLNGLWEAFDQEVKIFATGQRKPLRITCGKGLELRCSYKLVNKSLAAWCEDVKPRHKKMVGEIDYQKLRTPMTALEDADWDYMINDVICQLECLQVLMRGERLRTVPMTSTGFVRRSMRNASLKYMYWRPKFVQHLPSAEQYKLMTRAFVGGYTHANSFGLGIWHDVYSFRCRIYVSGMPGHGAVSYWEVDVDRDPYNR